MIYWISGIRLFSETCQFFAVYSGVDWVESAAVKEDLRVVLAVVVGLGPTLFKDLLFIVGVDSKGSAGDRELDDEDEEQDHHVHEQHHLVMLDGADEPDDGDEEEEDPAGGDTADDG